MWQKCLDTMQDGQDNYQKHILKHSIKPPWLKYHGPDVRIKRHADGKVQNSKALSSEL